MPVNKHIGQLWFDTQEEADAYDDLMLSNIELRSPDFENPHFSIMSMRERRERVPTLTPKVREAMDDHKQFIEDNIHRAPKSTLTACWEFPLINLRR